MRLIGEKKIEDTTCERAEELGIFNLKLNVKGNVGWPDRVFWIPGGKPFLIEFKKWDGKDKFEKLDDRQRLIIERLLYARYDVEVHDNVEEATESIRRRLESATLHAGRSGVHDKSALGRFISGSRAWKNINNSSRIQSSESEKEKQRNARRRAFAASAARMAGRKKQMERF